MPTLEQIAQPLPLAPPRLSLLNSIPVHEGADADARIAGQPWRDNAITWIPEPCKPTGVFAPECGATVNINPGTSTVGAIQHAQPFGVYAAESCTNAGSAGVDVQERATRSLGLGEAALVEKELWTGTLSAAQGYNNKRLNDNSVTQLNTGTATDPVRALGDLEYAIAGARSGGRCLIHCNRITVQYWIRYNLVYRSGNVLLTIGTDSIVVAGEGYDGSAPGGTAMPGTHASAWAYATGPIEAFRSTVDLVTPAGPEHTTSNRRTAIAKRLYVLEIDPCVYIGINVNHPTTT